MGKPSILAATIYGNGDNSDKNDNGNNTVAAMLNRGRVKNLFWVGPKSLFCGLGQIRFVFIFGLS